MVGETFSRMICKVKEKNLVEGVEIDKNEMMISHLQFANNLIILCKQKLQILRDVMRILRRFQVILGLRINFQNSSLMGIGVDMSVVGRWMKGKDNFMQNGIITLCLPRATIRCEPKFIKNMGTGCEKI